MFISKDVVLSASRVIYGCVHKILKYKLCEYFTKNVYFQMQIAHMVINQRMYQVAGAAAVSGEQRQCSQAMIEARAVLDFCGRMLIKPEER